jgi:predicted nuclease with TOPRIM domain
MRLVTGRTHTPQLKLRSSFDQQMEHLRSQHDATQAENTHLRNSIREKEASIAALQDALHKSRQLCKDEQST